MSHAASAAALPIMTESAKLGVVQARVALSPSRNHSADENNGEILRNYYPPRWLMVAGLSYRTSLCARSGKCAPVQVLPRRAGEPHQSHRYSEILIRIYHFIV